MHKGIILKKASQGFEVLYNNEIIKCFARGNIKTFANLQAGDDVELTKLENGDIVITKLLDRRNELVRPYISNLDQLIIMLSTSPKADLVLVDKLLIYCDIHKIEPILVVSKADVVEKEFFDDVYNQYKHIVKHILFTSTKTGQGINELKNLLKNKLSAFCGQSAVGKSSMLNAFDSSLNLKTNGVSQRINMGKNTTRETQIYVFENNTLIADTPGFNMLHFFDIDENELKYFYTEFDKHSAKCQYHSCNHIGENENECAVKRAVAGGKINKDRYDRYVKLFNTLQENRRKKYD